MSGLKLQQVALIVVYVKENGGFRKIHTENETEVDVVYAWRLLTAAGIRNEMSAGSSVF